MFRSFYSRLGQVHATAEAKEPWPAGQEIVRNKDRSQSKLDLLSKDKSLCNDIVSKRNNRYEWITRLTTWCLHLKLTSIELLPILICEPPLLRQATLSTLW